MCRVNSQVTSFGYWAVMGPYQVAKFLVPRIRAIAGDNKNKSTYTRFLTGFKAYTQILAVSVTVHLPDCPSVWHWKQFFFIHAMHFDYPSCALLPMTFYVWKISRSFCHLEFDDPSPFLQLVLNDNDEFSAHSASGANNNWLCKIWITMSTTWTCKMIYPRPLSSSVEVVGSVGRVSLPCMMRWWVDPLFATSRRLRLHSAVFLHWCSKLTIPLV